MLIRSTPIKLKPFAHQVKAMNAALDRFEAGGRGFALLMEMGTQKSCTSILIAANLFLNHLINKVIVVAPLSILPVWENEFLKFADFKYQVTVLKGTLPKKRLQLVYSQCNKDGTPIGTDTLQVIVVNYESSWRLLPELIGYGAQMMIVDESQKIKESRTNQSKGVIKLGDRTRYKLILTGTLLSKEQDVYGQYRFVDPTIFGDSFFRFRNAYFDLGGYENHQMFFKESKRDEFLKKLHSIAFRVTKEECLDLPEFTEEERVVELEPEAMKIYNTIKRDSYIELSGGNNSIDGNAKEVTATNCLTKSLRLSQIAGGYLTDDDKGIKQVSTAKLEALSDIVDSVLYDDKKLVIMARFIPEMDDIENLLHFKKIKYAVIRGGVKDRDEQVRMFQEDPDCKVFVGQIAAAGLGITLTASSTMVFYSLDYSSSNYEQAKARIHRSGQTQKCHYIYLIAKNTIDKKVIKALRDKIDLAKMLIDDYRNGLNPFESNEDTDKQTEEENIHE